MYIPHTPETMDHNPDATWKAPKERADDLDGGGSSTCFSAPRDAVSSNDAPSFLRSDADEMRV